MTQFKDHSQEIDWREVEKLFYMLLRRDGYGDLEAQELGFCIAQVLEDTYPLVKTVESHTDFSEQDSETIMEQLHTLFNNKELVTRGMDILIRKPRS